MFQARVSVLETCLAEQHVGSPVVAGPPNPLCLPSYSKEQQTYKPQVNRSSRTRCLTRQFFSGIHEP